MTQPGISADDLRRVELVEGDITRQQVDAIVNAANQSLLFGSAAYSQWRKVCDEMVAAANTGTT